MKKVLIGFMGAGKSSVAIALGKHTGESVTDLDDFILAHSPYETITDIFNAETAAGFRKRESEALTQQLTAIDGILSCGGGIVETPANISMLKSSEALVILLDVSFEEVKKRLQGDTTRPLFRDTATAEALYYKRLPLYRKAAHLTINTNNKTVTNITSEILDRIEEVSL